ncbi:hypothetical protein EC988_002424 [Linderina pennispora]|nr:hypothetical protein EC988_002424 [Linderina pennispora]
MKISLALAISLSTALAAVAPGFGSVTRGGSGGVTVTPTTLAELKAALCGSKDSTGKCNDTTPRIIKITKTFDFRGSEGTMTETGCITKACPNPANNELALARSGFCDGRTSATVKYDAAGTTPLLVGSNKSIIGVGSAGKLLGKGLILKGGQNNVVIQNIQISDINDGIIWGGDAIQMDGASNVVIDHNHFARIGRQMIVTGFSAAKFISITNNYFDGRRTRSSFCDGSHYWLWLFLGADDKITVANNYVYHTSGRGPHTGGLKNGTIRLHMVNNYFDTLTGEGAIDGMTTTSFTLAEGNYFKNVTYPVYSYKSDPGYVFAPFVGAQTSAWSNCQTYIGRACVPNNQSSGSTAYRPLHIEALTPLTAYRKFLMTPVVASAVPALVAASAGVGKI